MTIQKKIVKFEIEEDEMSLVKLYLKRNVDGHILLLAANEEYNIVILSFYEGIVSMSPGNIEKKKEMGLEVDDVGNLKIHKWTIDSVEAGD